MTRKLVGLAALGFSSEIRIYYTSDEDGSWKLHTATSKNGTQLHTHADHPLVRDISGKEIDPSRFQFFAPQQSTSGYELLYRLTGEDVLFSAFSTDGFSWDTKHQLVGIQSPCVLYTQANDHYAFVGKEGIHLARSRDGVQWTTETRPFIAPLDDKYGKLILLPQVALKTNNGILLVYLAKGREGDGAFYSLHAAFLDPQNPESVLQKSQPLWEQGNEWPTTGITPVGVAYYDRKLISYWDFHDEGLFAVSHSSIRHLQKPNVLQTNLQRLVQNPLLTPVSAHYWESKATFNPAAVTLEGKVHLLYRAIGDNDVSVMGYAVSSDAVAFDRFKTPAYVPREPFEGAPTAKQEHTSDPYSPFMSGGGGWGGCEDPRLTQIDDRMYLVYVAYNGWGPPRVAMSSISVDDFSHKVWNWAKPVLISPPGVVDKNAVIFPEKVNGKYVILHRIFPDILLDYVDSLDFDGNTFLKGEYKISPTRNGWDNRKVGAGAPPIKTKDGWLLIYHSVGEADPGRYKMGAMLLDLNDPTKVLYRTVSPILAPDHDHENIGWKAGVAYPCGAVVVDGMLYVYYGGADMVVCAATAKLDDFLTELKESGTSVLKPVSIHSTHKLR